jgi:prepilin signal peptidase PulO-like enzyme (type II secretory pathway)
MEESKDGMYVIPARYRKMENLHIIFWLLKDVSWCMIWKTLGIAMIIPTLVIAIVISWRTREIRSELAHNLAVTFWISANALWMISEFLHFDTYPIWQGFEGKHLALIPFAIGVIILMAYYFVQRPRETRAAQVATL